MAENKFLQVLIDTHVQLKGRYGRAFQFFKISFRFFFVNSFFECVKAAEVVEVFFVHFVSDQGNKLIFVNAQCRHDGIEARIFSTIFIIVNIVAKDMTSDQLRIAPL